MKRSSSRTGPTDAVQLCSLLPSLHTDSVTPLRTCLRPYFDDSHDFPPQVVSYYNRASRISSSDGTTWVGKGGSSVHRFSSSAGVGDLWDVGDCFSVARTGAVTMARMVPHTTIQIFDVSP